MKLNYDDQADALYLRLDDSKILESEEVAPGIVLDFNEKNQVVGVEMPSLSKGTGAGVPDLVGHIENANPSPLFRFAGAATEKWRLLDIVSF